MIELCSLHHIYWFCRISNNCHDTMTKVFARSVAIVMKYNVICLHMVRSKLRPPIFFICTFMRPILSQTVTEIT